MDTATPTLPELLDPNHPDFVLPHLNWDDDDYTYYEPVRLPTPAEHAQFFADQEVRVAQAIKDEKKYVRPVDVPDADSWTDDPFSDIQWPLGAFLEPEGYAAIQVMTRPNSRSYRRHMPRTAALARTICDALPELAVWGRQRSMGKSAWETITAGEWVQGVRKGKPSKFEQKQMTTWDVLKMLADPESRSLANRDVSGDQFSRVKHVRIDIDMDHTFNRRSWGQEDGDDLRDLVGEIALVRDVYAAFGLTAYVYRTGNRGIQAVAPIPFMDRAAAWVLTECVRTVLSGTRRRRWGAKDFQTSLDGLMRLPLGLHKATRSLGLFLGSDGRILPVEEQFNIVAQAFAIIPSDYDRSWADEMLPALGPVHTIPTTTLAELVAEFPRNPLVRQFLDACEEFEVRGWGEVCTHTTVAVDNPVGEPVDTSVALHEDEVCTHTTVVVDSSDEMLDEGDQPRKGSFWKSPRKLKEIGRTILDDKFHQGASFGYYMNTNGGKNAIGWALVLHDGDMLKAEDELVRQAREVGGSVEAVNDRIGLIKRLIPKNNTYERFQRRAQMFRHRALDGDVLETETLLAAAFVTALVEKRRTSAERVKTFQPKALLVIGHIVELAQMAARSSDDGLIRISTGTLSAQISHRWPEASVGKSAVVKLLEWITAGSGSCLVEALQVVYRPSRVTEPTVYEIGPGITDLIPVDGTMP